MHDLESPEGSQNASDVHVVSIQNVPRGMKFSFFEKFFAVEISVGNTACGCI